LAIKDTTASSCRLAKKFLVTVNAEMNRREPEPNRSGNSSTAAPEIPFDHKYSFTVRNNLPFGS
jgi:hypothetical protein